MFQRLPENHHSLTIAPFPASLEKNPYCDLLYANIEKLGVKVVREAEFTLSWLLNNRNEVNGLHFHWLTRYYQHWRGGIFTYWYFFRFAIKLISARLLGYRLFWTMHNFLPHNSPPHPADLWAIKIMGALAEVFVHCNLARNLLLNRGFSTSKKIHVIPHGNYIGYYPDKVSKEQAKNYLGIEPDKLTYLSFGLVRKYKGILSLAEIFSTLEDNNRMLLIVGEPFKFPSKLKDRLEAMAAHSQNIKLFLKYIPDEKVQYYFRACDYAVFNFDNILTSGSLILALSFGVPVIASKIGCLTELADTGIGIFYEPHNPDGLKKAILSASQQKALEQGKRAKELATRWDWAWIAKRHVEVFNTAIKKAIHV